MADGSSYLQPPQLADTRQQQQGAAQSQQTYCGSIPPQIVIPRARHNQVNYAVHRGQVSYTLTLVSLIGTSAKPVRLTLCILVQVYMW